MTVNVHGFVAPGLRHGPDAASRRPCPPMPSVPARSARPPACGRLRHPPQRRHQILTRLRLDPAKATTVLRALLVCHPPAHDPLTDDHELCSAAPTGPSTTPTHTSPLTSQFRLERPH